MIDFIENLVEQFSSADVPPIGDLSDAVVNVFPVPALAFTMVAIVTAAVVLRLVRG